MEYLEGQSLSALIHRATRQAFPLNLGVRILSDVLAGLQYAHDLTDYDGSSLGVVHRDVSPQNVFVTYGGHSKIVDFGIAKIAAAGNQTASGVIKGKAGYMAPEQISGGNIDARADVFAVGAMLWELLAGQRLIRRDEPEVAIITRRLQGDDPKIRDVAPNAPEQLLEICTKAMAHRPEERYPSAVAMLRELERYLGGAAASTAVDHASVAQLMETLFSEDRSKVRRLIDAAMREPPKSTSLPSLPSPSVVSGSHSMPGASVSGDAAPTTLQQRHRTPWVVLAGLAAVGVAAVVVVQLARRETRGPATGDTATIAAVSSANTSTPPTAAASVNTSPTSLSLATRQVEIRTTPKGALLEIDGAPVSNPFTGPITKATHQVRARASGYRTLERSYGPNDPGDLLLTLEPLATGPASAPTPQTRPTAKHQIDEQNPYP
jgi:serine/threonine-protein kinase